MSHTPEDQLIQAKKSLGIHDVVVLCGSMRFAEQMAEVAIEESVAGALVLKPDCNMKVPHPLWADPATAEEVKLRLDSQHQQKILLADRVVVVGSYIGDSTRSEIAYARRLGKPIRFTDPEIDYMHALASTGLPSGEAVHTKPETVFYTADVVVINPSDRVLLVERGEDPYRGMNALPGGHVDTGETSRQAAVRELFEETGVRVLPGQLTQVGVFDRPRRDPRGRYVSVAYAVVLDSSVPVRAGDDARLASWWPLDSLPDLAFDHREIISAVAPAAS
jgi:8-oxo-dGTP diphosphatase